MRRSQNTPLILSFFASAVFVLLNITIVLGTPTSCKAAAEPKRVMSAVSTDSEPELVKKTRSSPAGAIAANFSAKSNAKWMPDLK